jgi:hypothetical protein
MGFLGRLFLRVGNRPRKKQKQERREKMKKVTILGMGPAALFAAKACQNFGVEWECIGKQLPSLRGPIFFRDPLHQNDKFHPVKMELVGTAFEYGINKGAPGKPNSAMYFGLQQGDLILPGYEPNICMKNFRCDPKIAYKFKEMALTPEDVKKLEQENRIINTLPHPQIQLSISWMVLVRLKNYSKENFIRYMGTPSGVVVRWGCMWNDLFVELNPNIKTPLEIEAAWEQFSSSRQFQKEELELEEKLEFVSIREVLSEPLPQNDFGNILRVGRFSTMRNRDLAHDAYRQTWEWLVKSYA